MSEPVAGYVDAPGDPDPVAGCNVLKEAAQAENSARLRDDPAVQAD
jgi:hypothetical protein